MSEDFSGEYHFLRHSACTCQHTLMLSGHFICVFRRYKLDEDHAINFFGSATSLNAVVQFETRQEALRAVREKHMDVMVNNEVQLTIVS